MHIPKRKYIPITTTLAIILSAQQAAADLTDFPETEAIEQITVEAPVTGWTGFYAGAIAGWGDSENDAEIEAEPGINGGLVPDLFPSSLQINQGSFTTGLTVGYNLQLYRFVVGVEADAAYLDFDASSSYLSSLNPTLLVLKTETRQRMDFFSTVRGRVGVAIFERAMLFGTGGLAIGRVDYEIRVDDANEDALFTSESAWYGREKGFKLGWAAGAGAEYKFTENISVKLEGLYYRLAKSKAAGIGNDVAQSITSLSQISIDSKRKNNGVIARAGLNYRF